MEPQLFFHKDDGDIKWPAKIDMPLNKETETKPNKGMRILFQMLYLRTILK